MLCYLLGSQYVVIGTTQCLVSNAMLSVRFTVYIVIGTTQCLVSNAMLSVRFTVCSNRYNSMLSF